MVHELSLKNLRAVAVVLVLAVVAVARADDKKKLAPRYAAKDLLEVDASS
jgi:hypothetical protein